jgi:hypothetical protein
MKKFFLSGVFLLCISLSFSYAQHFIGKNKEEIKTLMRDSSKEFFFKKEVDTKKYHFLKYENADNTKTMLLILSKDGVCEYTKLMCDYALLKETVNRLNENYQYQKDQTWVDYTSDQEYDYKIELRKREWFFTIKTTRIKK